MKQEIILTIQTIVLASIIIGSSSCCEAFCPQVSIPSSSNRIGKADDAITLHGWFDGFGAGGSGKDNLDEEWEKQQEILKFRRSSQSDREKYFQGVEERRVKASEKQAEMWAWQTKKYKKGEDPIDEWKKRRVSGQISDLDNQYGDPDKVGGIPLPGASFGVGGEFGVGGKFDNGGRFDLRLPYADQGYVDEDADVMGKLTNFFGGGKKKSKEEPAPESTPLTPKKANKWPWEK